MDKLLGLPVVSVDPASKEPSYSVVSKAGPFKMIFGMPLIPPISREEVVRRKLELEPFAIATSFFFDKDGQLYCKPISGMTQRSEVFVWPGSIAKAVDCARVVIDLNRLVVILPNETIKADFGLMVERYFIYPASGAYLSFCRYQKVDEVMDWTGEPYLLLPMVTSDE